MHNSVFYLKPQRMVKTDSLIREIRLNDILFDITDVTVYIIRFGLRHTLRNVRGNNLLSRYQF